MNRYINENDKKMDELLQSYYKKVEYGRMK